MSVGIDIDIEKVRLELENSLWTDKNCQFYGRVYPNEKGEGEIIPEVYVGGDEYKEVLLDDNYDCIAFFYVDPIRSVDFAEVSVIFAVNVKNIYDGYSTRETERAMRDAEKVIRDTAIAINRPEIVTGIQAIEEFKYANQNKMDMHPFYLFRFDYQTAYDFYSPCPIPSNQYILTLSSDDISQGLAFSSPNKTIFSEGETATLYPAPVSGFEFSKWTINGVDNFNRNYILEFDSNKTVKPYFRLLSEIYYQELFKGSDADIVHSEFDIFNFGLGKTLVNAKSFNQVLTSDGSLVISFDTAPTIDDYNGTATPTINGNTIEVGAGQLYDLTVNGELFPLIETKGTGIWGVLGTKATLSTDVGVWDNLNENATNWLYILGGELYVNDITPTDKIRVIKGTNEFITPAITGYTKTEQHKPNAGVWDSGSEYLNQDNVGLNTIFDAYAGLAGLKNPNRWDFDILKAILTSSELDIDSNANQITNFEVKSIIKIFQNKPIQIYNSWFYLNQVAKSSRYKLIFYGDSITAGIENAVNYPLRMQALFGMTTPDYEFINVATGGKTADELDTEFNAVVAPLYDSSKVNIFIGFGFANGTETATEKVDSWKSMHDKAKALGMIPVISTATGAYGTYAAKQIEIQAANTELVNRASEFDYLNDFRAYDGTILFDWESSATYSVDNIHPVKAGNVVLASSQFDFLINNNLIEHPRSSQVKNSPKLSFSTGDYFPLGVNTDKHIQDHHIKFIVDENANDTGVIYSVGARFGSALEGFFIRTNGFSIYFEYAADSSTQRTITYPVQDYHGKLCEWIITETSVQFILDGVDLSHLLAIPQPKTAIRFATTTYQDYVGTQNRFNVIPTAPFSGDLLYLEHQGFFKYNLSEINGSRLYNSLADNYHSADAVTTDLAALRAGRTNQTCFNLDNDVSVWINGSSYIVAPVLATVTESGYSKLGDFPENSGFLIGITNSVLFPDTAELSAFDTQYGTTLNNTEKTFTELKALDYSIPPLDDYRQTVSPDGTEITEIKVLKQE